MKNKVERIMDALRQTYSKDESWPQLSAKVKSILDEGGAQRDCCESKEATAHRVDCPKFTCVRKSSQPENHHAAKNLERALETFKTRNKAYGDNYKFFGNVMQPLFPQGVRLETAQQWNRFGVIVQIMSKLTRYAWHGDKHGHLDSIHDIIPYAAMLEEIDAEIAGLRVVQPGDDEQRLLDLQETCEHIWQIAAGIDTTGKTEMCVVRGCGATRKNS